MTRGEFELDVMNDDDDQHESLVPPPLCDSTHRRDRRARPRAAGPHAPAAQHLRRCGAGIRERGERCGYGNVIGQYVVAQVPRREADRVSATIPRWTVVWGGHLGSRFARGIVRDVGCVEQGGEWENNKG
jgi:hypothetical protein